MVKNNYCESCWLALDLPRLKYIFWRIKNIIMKIKFIFLGVIVILAFLQGCQDNSQKQVKTDDTDTQSSSIDTAKASGTPCDISLPGIHFTKSVNGAQSLVSIDQQNKVTFKVGEKKDYFSDPNGKLSNNTAPILLAEVDNTKPFTLISKVTPTFTEKGLYNAGVLYIYVHDSFYQKFCFEQDERGKHRIVSVRTIGTSDDNNHDALESQFVYMKISSDTHTVASYYSLDKKTWHLVRLYKNNYPKKIWMGISSQCPVDTGSVSYFEDVVLNQTSVSDFRLGS